MKLHFAVVFVKNEVSGTMFTKKTNSFQKFQNDLKSGELHGALVFCGEEEFIINWAIDMLIKKFINESTKTMDFVEFEDKEMEIDKLVESLETLPFFSEKKVVLIRNFENKNLPDMVEIISQLGERVLLIITGNNIDKKIVEITKKYEFNELDNSQIVKFIEKRFLNNKVKYNRAILKTIAIESGYYNPDIDYNLYSLIGDIKKIIALTKSYGENAEVTIDIVRSSLSDNIEHGIFKMIDAIGNKRKDMSLDLLNQLILSGEKEHSILGAIISQLEVMLIVKELVEMGHGKEEIRKMTKIHQFRIQKSIGITRNYESETLRQMLKVAYETDIRIKRGLLDSKTALELLIGEI